MIQLSGFYYKLISGPASFRSSQSPFSRAMPRRPAGKTWGSAFTVAFRVQDLGFKRFKGLGFGFRVD